MPKTDGIHPGRLLRDLRQDLVHSTRLMRAKPGFTAAVVLTLALGIGANTAVFSVADAVLLRPLPFAEADRLVAIWTTTPPDGQLSGSAPPDFREMASGCRAFDGMGAAFWQDFNLTGGGEPERIQGAVVTADLLPLLGVKPVLGRSFLPGEEGFGNHRVVLMGDGLWKRRFGSDPSIPGRALTLNGETYVVAGVLPPGFKLPLIEATDLFAPLAFAPKDNQNTRNNHFLRIIGRLRRGVDGREANADLAAVMERVEERFPENAGMRATQAPLRETLVGDVRPALQVLLAAVGLVLLIACANIANLLLARATARGRETAVRYALGASRSRLIRQWLTESVVLGACGGAAGLLLAFWGSDLLLALASGALPRSEEIRIDARVLIFNAAASILSGLIFGLAPAFQASRARPGAGLRDTARGLTTGAAGRRGRAALVAVEMALALILLVGTGLMMRSFTALRRVEAGFDPSNVLSMYVAPPATRYREAAQEKQLVDGLLERTASIGGVVASGATTRLPLAGGGWGKYLTIEGREAARLQDVPSVLYEMITPGYTKAMGMRIVRGRDVAPADLPDAPYVALVNEAAARKLFPGEDPIGKKIRLAPPDALITPGSLPPEAVIHTRTIVGVMRDVRASRLRSAPAATVFAPFAQNEDGPVPFFVALRAAGDPAGMGAAMREQLRAVDPDLPVASMATMGELMSEAVAEPRLNLVLFAIFSMSAMTLSAVGLYGVSAFAVVQRTHEIGIRKALGARDGDILGMVLRDGMMPAAAGLAFGLIGAFAMTRLMSSLLYGVTPTDPITFGAAALFLAFVAMAASWLPARRAMHVDPMISLRYE